MEKSTQDLTKKRGKTRFYINKIVKSNYVLNYIGKVLEKVIAK